MCCQSCFPTEFVANYIFIPDSAANHVFPEFAVNQVCFPRMCCQACFLPECAANQLFYQKVLSIVFFAVCCQLGFVFPECTANHVFFPECAVNHVVLPQMAAHSRETNMISCIFWGKHGWQHILEQKT
jgi:hypothetical protein